MPFTRATWVWFKSQKVLQLIIIGVKSPSNPGVSLLFSWPVPPGSCSNAHLWAAAAGLLRRRSAGVCSGRFLFLILFGDFGWFWKDDFFGWFIWSSEICGIWGGFAVIFGGYMYHSQDTNIGMDQNLSWWSLIYKLFWCERVVTRRDILTLPCGWGLADYFHLKNQPFSGSMLIWICLKITFQEP